MGRAIKNIEKDKLEAIIVDLESKNTYTNRSALFTEVADKYNNLYGVNFSNSCGLIRAEKFGIQIKTPKGERGSHLKNGADALKEFRETGEVQGKKPKGDAGPMLAAFAVEEGGKYLALAKKIKRGSLKSAIKLKCLDCSAFCKDEIRNCQVTTCPLFAVRPYQ